MAPQVAQMRKRSDDDDVDARDSQKSGSADTGPAQGGAAGDQAEANLSGDAAKGSDSGGEAAKAALQDITEEGDRADAHTDAQ